MGKRQIFYIKMGAGSIRDTICRKYLNENCELPGIFIGWNEARKEKIQESIENELNMKNEGYSLSDKDVKKCWNPVLADLGRMIANDSVRTRAMKNIRDVCMATEDDIFFTFHEGRMWWCHPLGESGKNIVFNERISNENDLEKISAELKSKPAYQNEDIRWSDLIRPADGWKCTNISGEILFERNISGRLTRKQMIQGTMARLHEVNEDVPGAPSDHQLFLWTIGFEEDTVFADFDYTLSNLTRMIKSAISRLNPKDFESLTDMIFVKNGWIRIGGIGSNIKNIDGEYVKPITKETVFIQVKALLSRKELIDSVRALYDHSLGLDKSAYQYIVYHTLSDNLTSKDSLREFILDYRDKETNKPIIADEDWVKRLQFLDRDDLAELSLQSDIIQWLRRTAFPFNKEKHRFKISPGDLIVIESYPSIGKTGLALSMMLNMAKAGKSVLYFSCQFNESLLLNRIISIISGIPLRKIDSDSLSDDERESIRKAKSEFNTLKIKIESLKSPKISKLVSKSEEYSKKTKVDTIFIDYISPIKTEERTIDQELKNLAVSLFSSVIALNQIPEDNTGYIGKPYADSILKLQRESNSDTADLIVSDGFGKGCVMELYYNPRTTEFRKLEAIDI